MSHNRVELIGRLGRDPEMRRTNAGDPVVSFSMATSESWRDKASGERKERVEWHNIVVFNEGLATIAEQYLKKGSQAYIAGQLQTRDYTDRDGVQRRATEIVLQRFRGELVLLGDAGGGRKPPPADDSDAYGQDRNRATTRGAPRDAAKPAAAKDTRQTSEIIDDDIPF